MEIDLTGAIVGGGIDINVSGIADDNNGVVFNPFTGTIFVADEDDDVVREFTTAGGLLGTIDTDALGVDDTEGIAIDPSTGNILIIDDLVGNNTELFEITTAGVLISQTDLSTISGLTPQLALKAIRNAAQLYESIWSTSGGGFPSFPKSLLNLCR